MYYILNETHQVIAADDNFLSYCDVTHINELSVKIAKGVIGFDLDTNENITIITEYTKEIFSIKQTTFSSLLGQLTLINISLATSDEDDSDIISTLSDGNDSSIISTLKDEPSPLIDSIIKEEENLALDDINLDEIEAVAKEEQITFEDHLILDNDVLSLKEEASNQEEEKENLALDDINLDEIETFVEDEKILPPLDLPDDGELFDLSVDDTPDDIPPMDKVNLEETDPEEPLDLGLSDRNDNIDIALDTPQEKESSEIVIDSESISQKIGISNDDYKNFLNDFIDTALALEKDLQSLDDDTRNDATTTLSHLSEVLHLPIIADIAETIKDNNYQREDIESLYSTLSRLTTQKNNEVSEENVAVEIVEEKLELFDEPVLETIIQEKIAPREKPTGESFGIISLEGIKAKHFDFQLEEAANDLSLPVELIEEFVHDFIEQSHIETKKMLQAYEDGDLDTIQKIGHLLKGASSNLRINALSDTLYKIQFCENSSDLEILIKDYWAHFLSFETQINAISR